MKLKEFNSRYKYLSDYKQHKRVEYWTVMSPDSNGIYKGDCEDYILTLQAKVDGFNDLVPYYCKLNSVGHCVGLMDNYIIDCNCKELIPLEQYKYRYSITNLRKYWWIEIKFKMLQAWIYRRLNGTIK